MYLGMTSAQIGTSAPETRGKKAAACRASSAMGDTALPKYLTAAEAADVLRVGVWQVVKLCRDGVMPATKPGKAWLITEADLAEYLDTHSNRSAS